MVLPKLLMLILLMTLASTVYSSRGNAQVGSCMNNLAYDLASYGPSCRIVPYTCAYGGTESGYLCYSIACQAGDILYYTNTFCSEYVGTTNPNPTPTPSPTPTPTPDTIVDLWIDDVSINPENPKSSADGIASLAPGSTAKVVVSISGFRFNKNESRTSTVQLAITNRSAISKPISLAAIKTNGRVDVIFEIPITKDDVGDLNFTATVSPNNTPPDSDFSDNIIDFKAHVLCNVSDFGTTVPYFQQFQSPWGATQYAKSIYPKNKPDGSLHPKAGQPVPMSSLGCMTTSLAMIYNAYGINKAPDGATMNPGSVNTGLLHTDYSSSLGPDYAVFNGYTPGNDVQQNGAVAFARDAYYKTCTKNGGGIEACLTASKSAISYKWTRNSYSTADAKVVNKELCNGNPVILKVPSIREPQNLDKAHYVVAIGMTIDSNGEAQYITQDPGRSNGEGRREFQKNARGYRLYRPTDDPSMIFIHLTAGADMVITDPHGRRIGYNPTTNESYSEIPGATFFPAETIGSADEDFATTIPESRFEGLEPEDGQYQIKIYAKGTEPYQLTSYRFDTTGTINGITAKAGTLVAGTTTAITINHSAAPASIAKATLMINKADFIDSRHRDMAFIHGKISLLDGTSLSTIKSGISIKVGPFSKSIEAKRINKFKFKGKTYYTYSSVGKNGLVLKINVDTGDFEVFISNIDLDDKNPTLTTTMSFQVDDVIATSPITFKNIKRNKCGHR